MKHTNKEFCIEVWGNYACFTRPEMKVERVSYDVITPSAARAVFEAIFWKPAFQWIIKKIEVLEPIRWISVRRNEVGALINEHASQLFIEEKRQQKAGLFLRDVRYRLFAELEFIPPSARKPAQKSDNEVLADQDENTLINQDENPGKYYAIFERRARKGQCFNQPYFGCREFAANFRLIENPENESRSPIRETRELGFMLYDMDFSNEKDPIPMFFKPVMNNGTIVVPTKNSEEVKK